MTVLVALEHARARRRRHRRARTRPTVGESTIDLRAGRAHHASRDLVEAALIQSANDAADALALHVADGDSDAFVG